MVNRGILPQKIFLQDYGGNYGIYINAVYDVFKRDFIEHRATFGSHRLGMKKLPIFQEREYTFYHMTHKGDVESERIPDLRRCECLPWARPTVENTSAWSLKFWRQTRSSSKNRVCIALEIEDETYFIILEVRKTYVLLWTAFLAEHRHQARKKLAEFEKWKLGEGRNIHTPDELVELIQSGI